jgi:hypothetical protein
MAGVAWTVDGAANNYTALPKRPTNRSYKYKITDSQPTPLSSLFMRDKLKAHFKEGDIKYIDPSYIIR